MEEYISRLGLNFNFAFVILMAALIWTRILSVFSVIPFLFARPTPRNLRIGASVVITVFLYPILVGEQKLSIEHLSVLTITLLFVKEVLFGLSIGFVSSLLFYGFQSAGQMIDNQRGVSLARILIPQLGEQVSISGNFLFQFAIVVFLLIGGHRLFLQGLLKSYLVLPLLEFPESVVGLFPLMDLFGRITAQVLFISVQISAPVIIAVLLVDVILGVANRFAPQINVWELGFNVRGYVGILILFLSITFVARQIEKYTAESYHDLTQAIDLFKGKLPSEELPVEETPEPELEAPVPVVPIPYQ